MCVGNGFARAAFVAVMVVLFGGMAVADEVVTIPDSALEFILREELAKPSGDILDTDLATITDLHTRTMQLDVAGIVVHDLAGLEYCIHLRFASLYPYSQAFVDPLRDLPSLEEIDVPIADSTTSFAALAAISALRRLSIGEEGTSLGFTDLASVAALTNLTSLTLRDTNVRDLTPLQALTSLEQLSVWGSPLADLAPLAGMGNLKHLHFSHNLISGIAPLVANVSFAQGDSLRLYGVPLSQVALCNEIPTLTARGVTVEVFGSCGLELTVLQQPAGGWVEVGAEHTLSVLVDGYPEATYQWFKDGRNLGMYGEYADYHIPAVSDGDSGVYQCVVATENGTVLTQPARLNVVPENSLPATSLAGLAAACMACAALAVRKLARRG